MLIVLFADQVLPVYDYGTERQKCIIQHQVISNAAHE